MRTKTRQYLHSESYKKLGELDFVFIMVLKKKEMSVI